MFPQREQFSGAVWGLWDVGVKSLTDMSWDCILRRSVGTLASSGYTRMLLSDVLNGTSWQAAIIIFRHFYISDGTALGRAHYHEVLLSTKSHDEVFVFVAPFLVFFPHLEIFFCRSQKLNRLLIV